MACRTEATEGESLARELEVTTESTVRMPAWLQEDQRKFTDLRDWEQHSHSNGQMPATRSHPREISQQSSKIN